ncbi:MAG: hypothetical protein FD181_843 [Prolixibacteraceae bacterium]|nr:MAG: hypothetical protein FD181_843 [Prolixibacteraceae bacterium]
MRWSNQLSNFILINDILNLEFEKPHNDSLIA